MLTYKMDKNSTSALVWSKLMDSVALWGQLWFLCSEFVCCDLVIVVISVIGSHYPLFSCRGLIHFTDFLKKWTLIVFLLLGLTLMVGWNN